MLSFFFDCDVHHLDLPSFPTRRSSDLSAFRLRGVRSRCISGPCSPFPPDHGPSLDRKSTRLNSSHTVISYAVFCLKKKTLASQIIFPKLHAMIIVCTDHFFPWFKFTRH